MGAILAETLLAAVGMALLVLPGLRSARGLGLIGLGTLALALGVKLFGIVQGGPSSEGAAFSAMLLSDRLGEFLAVAILGVGMFIVLSVMGYPQPEVQSRREFYALFLFTVAGLLVVVSAQHLILVYLGLELVSLLSYLMTGFEKRQLRAGEAALKYFLFGAISTGAMLYGFSLLFGLTGTLELPALAKRLPEAVWAREAVAGASLLLIVVGLGFKVAWVPFHMWAPDAYEGASTPVASFLSLGPKLAGFAVLVRVVWLGLGVLADTWSVLFGTVAVLTMTLGNLAALTQTNVKRLLAYSSIAHAGTLAIGLAVATPLGLTALMYYLVAYLFMNAGAFAGVIAVGNDTGREDVEAFRGLSRRRPALAFLMAVCLLSLAGIPPLAGFFAKLWIFAAALQAHAVSLAMVAAVNSVIALFYYARILQAMYLAPAPVEAPAPACSKALLLVMALCAVGLFAVGLWQGPWLSLAAASLPAGAIPSEGWPWL